MRILLAGFAGLVAVAVLYLAWLGYAPGKAAPQTTEEPTITAATYATTTDVYTVSLKYPVFGLEAADKHVKSIVDEALTNFTTVPPNPTPITAGNEMLGEFDHEYVGPDYLSAKMQIYEFTGGAHGGTVAYGLNFHRDGTEVTLDEALSLIGKNLQQVSEEATEQLIEHFGMVQFPDGAAPTAENYSTFLINDKNVTFIFQQYQVQAYAAGMPEISFARVK
jgi:hypothetical protein